MAITPLPNPPSRSDPANFPERADAFMAALPAFAEEANLLQVDVNATQRASAGSAEAAFISARDATNARGAAQQDAAAAEAAKQVAADQAELAEGGATRAKDWASKLGGPVEGGEFSAKHYARLAEAGAGLPVFALDNVPTDNIGPIYIVGKGLAEWDESEGEYRIQSAIPVGTPDWWPLRSSIPAGQIPQDGQTLPRSLFPDLTAMVVGGLLPVVAEAEWWADPLLRGSYTLGDGSTTIRVPDFNGKSAGSLGAVFRRGDGAMSAGTGGVIQRDAMQVISGSQSMSYGNVSGPGTGPFTGSRQQDGAARSRSDYSYTGPQDTVRFDNTGVVRTATENRSLNITGAWTVHAFGAVVNPGSLDAAQLASNLAALNSAFQGLAGSIGYTVIYPGGTPAAPGIINANTRMIVENPFPGYAVRVEVEHYLPLDGAWFVPGWFCGVDRTAFPADPFIAWGLQAHHIVQMDKLIVQAGKNGTASSSNIAGGAYGTLAANQGNAYFRLKVWKLKGLING